MPAAPVTPTGKQIVLLIAILAGFITPFDGSAVNIALPAMGAEFHMDAISLSWIATAYLLAAALFLVPFGKIADIYGRKRIFLYGIAIFSLASLVMTMVPTTNLLIGVRILQGFGGAMIFGTSIAILTSVFPPGERGKALGIYLTAVYFGLTLGPFLGGVLTQYLWVEEHLLCQRTHRHYGLHPHSLETGRRMGGVRGRALRSSPVRSSMPVPLLP